MPTQALVHNYAAQGTASLGCHADDGATHADVSYVDSRAARFSGRRLA